MSVEQVTNDSPFIINLATPADVGASGQIELNPENFAPTPPDAPVQSVFGRTGIITSEVNDYLASEVRNDSNAAGGQVSDALDLLDAAVGLAQGDATQALADSAVVWLTVYVADIVAPGSVFVPAPVTGTLTTLRMSLSAQPDMNYAVVSQIGGTPVTGGVVTVQSTDAPGTVRSATPSAANAVTVGTSSVELILPDLQGNPGNGVVLLGFTR